MAVLLAVGLMATTPGAIAQTGRSGQNQNPAAPGINTNTPALNAPVGHRQPRRGDVPSESLKPNPNDPIAREDAELDRKLKSICRGC
ncbi:MAG: hypothetical protein M9932_02160 [Xanthobacteraceae bacterium]|nr:hypothetical protein [Xanthobacteraceae bacterium]